MGDGYHAAGEWNGLAQYECDRGDFGPSTREDLVREHVRLAHPPRHTGLVSATGEPLDLPPEAFEPPPPIRDPEPAGGQTDTETEGEAPPNP